MGAVANKAKKGNLAVVCCSTCHTRTVNDLSYLEKLILSELLRKAPVWEGLASSSCEFSKTALLIFFLRSVSLNKFVTVRNRQKVRRVQRQEGEQNGGKEQCIVSVLSHQVINGYSSSIPSVRELPELAESWSGSVQQSLQANSAQSLGGINSHPDPSQAEGKDLMTLSKRVRQTCTAKFFLTPASTAPWPAVIDLMLHYKIFSNLWASHWSHNAHNLLVSFIKEFAQELQQLYSREYHLQQPGGSSICRCLKCVKKRNRLLQGNQVNKVNTKTMLTDQPDHRAPAISTASMQHVNRRDKTME